MAEGQRPTRSGRDGRPPRPTITDIATLTGLSKATVSRAINGRPRISAQTRARVLATLEEVGYAPSRAATSLSTGRSGLIGLMIGENRDPNTLAIMEGALSAAVPAHYGVVVYMTSHEREHATIYTEMIARGSVDGALLLFPGKADEPFVQRVRASGLPLVLIEPQVEVPGVPSVHADSYSDGYRSTRHLLDLGHRRIGLCATFPAWGLDRYLDGYQAALAEARIPADPALGLAAGWSYEVGYQTALRWLRLAEPATGMCFCCDTAALGALAAAWEAGLRVPDDVSIVGYDDTEVARWIKPALTTPHERRLGLVRQACELLLALIHHTAPPSEPLLIPTDLTVRQSTGPAPRR